jgi:hypothetical protein
MLRAEHEQRMDRLCILVRWDGQTGEAKQRQMKYSKSRQLVVASAGASQRLAI